MCLCLIMDTLVSQWMACTLQMPLVGYTSCEHGSCCRHSNSVVFSRGVKWGAQSPSILFFGDATLECHQCRGNCPRSAHCRGGTEWCGIQNYWPHTSATLFSSHQTSARHGYGSQPTPAGGLGTTTVDISESLHHHISA